MIALTGVRIKVTTNSDLRALQSFYSYTLPNTPFYFNIYFENTSKSYREYFSNNQIIWDFGDGTTAVGLTAEHFYRWPGEYVVKATLYDVNGETYTIYPESDLLVYNAIPDIVTFGGLDGDLPHALLAGRKSPPLNVYRFNSWQYDGYLNNNSYRINLYAANSNSSYISVSSYYSSQWSHLKAYWGFVLESANENNYLQETIVDSTLTDSVSIYAEKVSTGFFNNTWNVKLRFYSYPAPNTVFCGTSGSIPPNYRLRFVDQKPSDNSRESYVALYGSIDTSIFKDENYKKYNYNPKEEYGFINTLYSTLFVKTLFNPASSLKITSNGISEEGIPSSSYLSAFQLNYTFDIFPIKYTNSKIPFVITLKDGDSITTKCYPLLSLNNDSPLSALSINDVKVDLVYLTKGQYLPLTFCNIRANTAVPAFNESGSYFAGILECTQDVNAVAISATALIVDNPIAPPNKSIGYVMQPGLNKLRKVTNGLRYGYFDNLSSFNVTIDSAITTTEAQISGGAAITYVPIYQKPAFASDPGLVWVSNSDTDFIYIFTEDGSPYLRPINLKRAQVFTKDNRIRNIDITEKKSAAAASMAADSKGDMWVAFRDCLSSFKFDRKTLIGKTYAFPDLVNTQYYAASTYISLSAVAKGFVGENSVLPTSLDVDKKDNVFIVYSNPLSSFVIGYDKNGSQIDSIPFAFPNTAKQILIDLDDNLWITTFNNSPINSIDNPQTQRITNRKDFLYYIDRKNLSNSFVKPFSFLGDLTMDSGGNVWVNSRNNIISRVTKNGVVSSFRIGNPENPLDFIQDFGGIAGDINGSLWVINNTEGSLQFFDTLNPRQLTNYQIPRVPLPESNRMASEDGTVAYYLTVGDFTGVRWLLKNRILATNFPRMVTGLSNLFSIKRPIPGIVKYNENYDLAKTVNSYVLQESFSNAENLFNNFFKPILNSDDNSTDALGKVIYERIANFTNNNVDVDKCNIDSLDSIYEMFGEKLDELTFTVPPNLKRLLNTLSIKKSVLFGSENKFSKNFTLSSFDYDIASNIGSKIDIEKGYFIPGKPIISYELFSKKYNLIQNTLVRDLCAKPGIPYPLSCIKPDWGWGLVLQKNLINSTDLKNYYIFYNFNEVKNQELYDGVIDFNDPLTTVNKNTTSFDDWTTYAGDMDYALGSNIYKNMGIASSVTTNYPLPEPVKPLTIPRCYNYVLFNNQTLKYYSEPQEGCYIYVDKDIEIFNITVDNRYGIYFGNYYDFSDPLNSKIILTTVGPFSSNRPLTAFIGFGEQVTISYNDTTPFTFYSFTTAGSAGSIYGFTLQESPLGFIDSVPTLSSLPVPTPPPQPPIVPPQPILSSIPVITSPVYAYGAFNEKFFYNITATNTPTSYNVNGLLNELSINKNTGLISGTPTNMPGISYPVNISLSAFNASGVGVQNLELYLYTKNLSALLEPPPPPVPPSNQITGSIVFAEKMEITGNIMFAEKI